MIFFVGYLWIWWKASNSHLINWKGRNRYSRHPMELIKQNQLYIVYWEKKYVAPSSHHKAADFKWTKSYGSVLRLRQWLRWSPTLAEADGGENRHCVWPSLPSGNLTYGFRWLIEIEDLPIYLSKMVIFDGKLLNSQMVNGHQECLAIATLTMLHVDDLKFTDVYVCNVARDSCPTSNVRVWSNWPHSPLNIPKLDGWKLNKERQCWIFDPPVFNPSVLGGKSGELKIQDDPKIRGLSRIWPHSIWLQSW